MRVVKGESMDDQICFQFTRAEIEFLMNILRDDSINSANNETSREAERTARKFQKELDAKLPQYSIVAVWQNIEIVQMLRRAKSPENAVERTFARWDKDHGDSHNLEILAVYRGILGIV